MDGFVGRFAAAHFGQRNACSPLNCLMRCIQRFLARRAPPPTPALPAPPAEPPTPAPALLGPARPSPTRPRRATRRGLDDTALHSAVWVDDTVFATKTPPHPVCAGLTGACPVCCRSARAARRSQVGWHRLAAELALGLSDEKRQTPSQRVTYTGMVVDTFHRTLSMPPEKATRLAAFLETFFGRREASLSELASLRGRIQHYSACLPYILPYVALLSSVMGTEGDPDYSRVIQLPPAVSDTALHVRGVLAEHCKTGRPLWPFVPSTLYAAFLAHETGSARIAVLTWDASLHGWGLLLRWWENKDGKLIIGSLPDTEDMRHQVRRETFAGVLSFEAAAREVDLSDATVLFRNDAVGALVALRKGSFTSTFLQLCAMRSCHLHRRLRSNALFLHAPGRVLMAEGIDGHSREGALAVTSSASGPRLRAFAHELAATCGWTITVDAFASECNSLLPRFYARYAEPNAEVEDAFTVPDWDQSVCPACGHMHRETMFAFPPPSLLNAFVAKARADGIRAIVLTPLAVTAPYWNKLLRASVVPNAQGYHRFRNSLALSDSDVAGHVALFAVDFAPASARHRTEPVFPPCGREGAFRGRNLAGSNADLADRQRIHDELAAVGLALRP